MRRKEFRERKTINKRKVVILIILILIALLGTVLIVNKSSKIKEDKFSVTPEILKSMEYSTVQKNDEKTESEFVTFDAFFLKDIDGDGNADSLRGTCNEIGKSDTLYFQLRVIDDGYFKDGTITINGENFYLGTTIVKDGIVKANYISNNTKKIQLNDIQNGTQKMFTGIIRSGDYSNYNTITSAIGNNTNNYSKENSITLTGTHISDNGTETKINKTVKFNVDWYGTTSAGISTTNISNSVTDFSSLYNDTSLNLSFSIQTSEKDNDLIIKDNVLTGKIPELNGYMPTSVTITGNNITYDYNNETGEFSVRRDAIVNESGVVTTNAYTSQNGTTRYNSYTFNVEYPKQAYEETENQNITIKIPVQTYYEGYNNPDDEFGSPYVSNVASATVVANWYQYIPKETVYSSNIDVQIGRYLGYPYNKYYISKEKPLKIYNNISETESEDYYTVSWYAFTGTNTDYSGIVFKENVNGSNTVIDNFITKDSEEISMDGLTTNVGIYFSNPANLLGDDGWIRVYNDDTDTLIVSFDSTNWNNYDSNNPYMYNEGIKHIRVETSKTNSVSSMYIYNIKELQDMEITDKYDLEEFDLLKNIKTTLNVYLGDSTSSMKDTATAIYESPFSVASLEISEKQISTQETYENQKIKITTKSSNFMEQKWKNGVFILKMPDSIIDVELNDITISEPSVKITDKNLYEENGAYYLRIETENEEDATYTITVDCNITPDPRIPTTTENFEMYAKNENGVKYYYSNNDTYDVDTNGNTEENVHKSTVSIELISPNSLLSNQIAKDYDEKGSVTIAPLVAKTDKNQRTAVVEMNVTNNYSNDITDVLIQGVIPFENNKYVLGNRELGSEFNTYMSNIGINIPDSVKDYAKVYYSTKETPSNDINNSENGWVLAEQVTDWNSIKTFIIDLGDYEIEKGKSLTFSYEINIPEGVEYNQVSYSGHAVYFSLKTDAGLYATSTSVAKLGFMIAKQYDLEITKYQENTSKTLSGVAYKLTEVGNESYSVKKVTDSDGKVIILGLYAERTYKLQETKIGEDYVLNGEEIIFYTTVDNNGNLQLVYRNEDGTFQNLPDVYSCIKSAEPVKEAGKDYTVKIALEDEVKAKLKITKLNGTELLKGVKFKLTGRGKNGITLTTNSNGTIQTSGLYLNETYTLEETKATGYYLIEEPITFSISSSESGFKLNVNGDVSSSKVTTIDEIPTINLNIDNESIPTYSLKVTKYAEHKDGKEDITLSGAQFKLTGDGLGTNGKTVTTDENGILNIDGLYEYVKLDDDSSKGGFSGEYTLTEIYAPEGYALDSTPITFRGFRNSNGELEVEILSENNRISSISELTVKDASSNNPVLEFAVEDPLIFTLTKYDENNEPLEGVEFSVYSLNDNLDVKDFAKDINGEYIGELIGEAPITFEFTSNNTSFPWKLNDDGIWESTNHADGSNVTMTSNEISLSEARTLTFDWSVSSESLSYDYVYYTIENVDTNAIIGGNKTESKIGGTNYGTSYDSLKWLPVSIPLEAGKYTISFTYRKDGSQSRGTDTAYVKNLSLGNNGKYAVRTDKNGELSLNLPEGYYKAVEVGAPVQYYLSENEDSRTQYFGVGSSKAQEIAFKVNWKNSVVGEGWNTINSVYSTSDGGLVAVRKYLWRC